MKSSEPEPLIEVIQTADYETETDGIVKFKGKLLHSEVITFCDADCLEVDMPAEILFDFNAGELPEDIFFGKQMSENECLQLLRDVTLYRKKRYVEMEFHFDINLWNPPKIDLNPFTILAALSESIRKEGYKINAPLGEFDIQVVLPVPFGDNVYSHYNKHLAVFEKMSVQIERDTMEGLKKRF